MSQTEREQSFRRTIIVIGFNARARRKALGLSILAVALRSGFSQEDWIRIESAARNLNVHEIVRIATALDTSVANLVSLTPGAVAHIQSIEMSEFIKADE